MGKYHTLEVQNDAIISTFTSKAKTDRGFGKFFRPKFKFWEQMFSVNS